MKELFFLLCGGAIGAGLSWLMDDQRGRQRQEMLRGRLMEAREEVEGRIESARREVEPKIREARERLTAQAQSNRN